MKTFIKAANIVKFYLQKRKRIMKSSLNYHKTMMVGL